MKKSNNQLRENLNNKNINVKFIKNKKFNSYSYYQVINAYKELFIEDIETIDQIEKNINNNVKINYYEKLFNVKYDSDFFINICKRICLKYNIKINEIQNVKVYKTKIKEKDYIHHCYPLGTQYSEFIRIYKFEHELRMLLLKYTLMIEENIKSIFISTLNDFSNIDTNFLNDINNYDTSINNRDSIDTIKKIYDKQKNMHSKPIIRKRQQNVIIPYWIIINELAMNETYHLIQNLKKQYKDKIIENLLFHFSLIEKNTIDVKEKYKNGIFNIIRNIGMFRNMLAHNQPLYSYNHSSCKIESLTQKKFNFPYVKQRKNSIISEEEILIAQRKFNSSVFYDFKILFGTDKFNSKNSDRDYNLSTIIYTIYKMICNIDKDNNMKSELEEVFNKYNICLTKNNVSVKDIETIKRVLSIVNNEKTYINYEKLVNLIDCKKKYKEALKEAIRTRDEYINILEKNIRQIELQVDSKKYQVFSAIKRYSEFTGITQNFFEDIK